MDLRGSNRESPISVGGLTESQCGSWLQSRASDAAACGCKQKLAANHSCMISGDFLGSTIQILVVEQFEEIYCPSVFTQVFRDFSRLPI